MMTDLPDHPEYVYSTWFVIVDLDTDDVIREFDHAQEAREALARLRASDPDRTENMFIQERSWVRAVQQRIVMIRGSLTGCPPACDPDAEIVFCCDGDGTYTFGGHAPDCKYAKMDSMEEQLEASGGAALSYPPAHGPSR